MLDIFYHLLIEIATPSKSWAQILTHKILVSTSLKNSQVVGEAIKNRKSKKFIIVEKNL